VQAIVLEVQEIILEVQAIVLEVQAIFPAVQPIFLPVQAIFLPAEAFTPPSLQKPLDSQAKISGHRRSAAPYRVFPQVAYEQPPRTGHAVA